MFPREALAAESPAFECTSLTQLADLLGGGVIEPMGNCVSSRMLQFFVLDGIRSSALECILIK